MCTPAHWVSAHAPDRRATGVKAVAKLFTALYECARCSFVVRMTMDVRKDGYDRSAEILKKRLAKVQADHFMLDHTLEDRRERHGGS